MRKIPTLFERDHEYKVVDRVNPLCDWVPAGEGYGTAKADGVCVMLDHGHKWWGRREVKSGADVPPGFLPVDYDVATGKTFGWIPVDPDLWSFHRFLLEAEAEWHSCGDAIYPGTFELIGPNINGNRHQVPSHRLAPHGAILLEGAPLDYSLTRTPFYAPRDFAGLSDLFARWDAAQNDPDAAAPTYEGIVWHHPDGRKAKIKRRDFRR